MFKKCLVSLMETVQNGLSARGYTHAQHKIVVRVQELELQFGDILDFDSELHEHRLFAVFRCHSHGDRPFVSFLRLPSRLFKHQVRALRSS